MKGSNLTLLLQLHRLVSRKQNKSVTSSTSKRLIDFTNTQQEYERVLVLSGGGAKGAYAFGCLKAFKERNIHFDAVSGTSVGGLNAMLWSTNAMAEGQKLWDELSFSTVYPVRFLNPGRYPKFFIQMFAMIIVFLNLIGSTMKGIKHPASLVTSSLLTIVAGFPYLIFLLWIVSGMVWVFLETGRTDTDAIRGALLAASVPLICLLVMFHSFHKGNLTRVILLIVFWMLIGSFALPIVVTTPEGDAAIVFSLLSLGLTITALFSRVFFITTISDYVLGMIGTVLDSTPLKTTVKSIISSKPLSIPTYITTASLQALHFATGSLDRGVKREHELTSLGSYLQPGWKAPEVVNSTYFSLAPVMLWVPNYINIIDEPPEDAAFYSVASAALPFGIVPPVKLQGKESQVREFVDGGVVDNIPFYPFVKDCPTKEIYVVILENFSSDEEAQKKSQITPEAWSELSRLQLMAKVPNQGRNIFKDEWEKANPYESPTQFPKLTFFYPRSGGLGNFLTGTLNFNGAYAKGIMEQGYLETLQKLDKSATATRS
jgi:predicted acylesterase/phospholipase RssA